MYISYQIADICRILIQPLTLLKMKNLRLVAAILLILNGALHLVEYRNDSAEAGSIGILVFGLIYIITGFLLFHRRLYSLYLGLIIPAIGMTLSFVKYGIPDLFSLPALFKVIGVTVIICCLIILVRRK